MGIEIAFDGQIAVITGGASGIGIATARLLVESGARVFLLDVDPRGRDAADSLGDAADFHLCDVASGASVAAAFEAIRDRHGAIHFLINNAGIQSYGSVTESSEEEWDRTLDVNLKGAFLCAKQAIPLMTDGSRVIVNVASVKSFVSQDREAAYVASKAGLLGLTRSIATDYAPRLRCVAVCPGAVRTPLLMAQLETASETVVRETESIHLLERIAEPEEIANFIVFLVSDLASFATGHAFRVDGGIGVRIAGT